MKISKISTGNKLKYKTFGELKPGDKLYAASVKSYKIWDFPIQTMFKSESVEKDSFTELNPNKIAHTICDLVLVIEGKDENYYENVPSGATYIAKDDTAVYATSEELLLPAIKKYKSVLK